MANANPTRMIGGNEPQSETPIMDLHCDWQAYSAWLDSPACDDMDDDEYEHHVGALTCLERRILRAPSVSAQDLASQIEVMTGNWQEGGCGDDLRALVSRASTHQGMGVAA